MAGGERIRVGIIVFDGVEELDFSGPYEVLKLAVGYGADAEVSLCASTDSLELTACHGLRFSADAPLGAQALDLVVVPGGGWNARDERGAWAEARRGELPAALAAMHRQGTLVASVCTGGMLLASAGLLRGRHATTHLSAAAELQALGAILVDARVVDEGDIVTSGGIVAGIDLGLWLVERFFGRELAADLETELEYVRREPVWLRGGG